MTLRFITWGSQIRKGWDTCEPYIHRISVWHNYALKHYVKLCLQLLGGEIDAHAIHKLIVTWRLQSTKRRKYDGLIYAVGKCGCMKLNYVP